MKAWIEDKAGLALLGDLPGGVTVEVCTSASQLPSDPADVEFWTPPFLGTGRELIAMLDRMPALRVLQLLSAGADAWVGSVPDGVHLCDARGVHDAPTSEWVLAAILGYLRHFPSFALAQARGEWTRHRTDELAGKRVLIVGAGSISDAIGRRLLPFEVDVTRVARRARPGVHAVEELPALLPEADIVVLIVPLTPATTGLVDAAFLAAMPAGALLVNAARGPVVDTGALTAALVSGRIGAAVDVTDPEPLPPGHPLWSAPNLLLTPHVGGAVPGMTARAYRLVGEQLRRYAAGQPVVNVVVDGY